MRIVSLINGSLIAQTAAVYALHYAKALGVMCSFVHIRDKDELLSVKQSAKELKREAEKLGVACELEYLETIEGFSEFVRLHDVDMVFCSTRHDHGLFDQSFVQKLLAQRLVSDMAVVKVVKLGAAQHVEKLILPIRQSKLSINKFSFFALISLAYQAKAELFSVDKISKKKLAFVDAATQKTALQKLVFALRHYMRVAKMSAFKFSVKHAFSLAEGDSVQNHIIRQNFDLAIVGGHHDRNYRRFFGLHPIDVLFDEPMINTIYFISSKDQK